MVGHPLAFVVFEDEVQAIGSVPHDFTVGYALEEPHAMEWNRLFPVYRSEFNKPNLLLIDNEVKSHYYTIISCHSSQSRW